MTNKHHISTNAASGWMLGHSGSKLYLHNFEYETSYLLLSNQSWSSDNELIIFRCSG